jgi:hypothetical protein
MCCSTAMIHPNGRLRGFGSGHRGNTWNSQPTSPSSAGCWPRGWEDWHNILTEVVDTP